MKILDIKTSEGCEKQPHGHIHDIQQFHITHYMSISVILYINRKEEEELHTLNEMKFLMCQG